MQTHTHTCQHVSVAVWSKTSATAPLGPRHGRPRPKMSATSPVYDTHISRSGTLMAILAIEDAMLEEPLFVFFRLRLRLSFLVCVLIFSCFFSELLALPERIFLSSSSTSATTPVSSGTEKISMAPQCVLERCAERCAGKNRHTHTFSHTHTHAHTHTHT